jgi:hypothetical protein
LHLQNRAKKEGKNWLDFSPIFALKPQDVVVFSAKFFIFPQAASLLLTQRINYCPNHITYLFISCPPFVPTFL